MTINWSALLLLLKSEPALFLATLKTLLANPAFVTGLVTAAESGSWAGFLTAEIPTLLALLGPLVTAMEANPVLTTAVLNAVTLPAAPPAA
jgi:hypothetical protein